MSVASLSVIDIEQNNHTNNYILTKSQGTLKVCDLGVTNGLLEKVTLKLKPEWRAGVS